MIIENVLSGLTLLFISLGVAEKIKPYASSENQENHSQQPLKTNSNVGNKSYGVEKNELGSMETGELISSGVEDHLPKSDFSPADTKFAKQKKDDKGGKNEQ